MTDAAQAPLEDISLTLDNGISMSFRGRQFAGGSWFDEESNVLTRQNLYVTDTKEHVYSIVTGSGKQRSRRAYRVTLQGDTCIINDGRNEMTIGYDMLMLAVRSLTGLDQDATPTLEMIEETLNAANC